MKKAVIAASCFAIIGGAAWFAFAQPPHGRLHRVTEKGELCREPATSEPSQESEVSIEVVGDLRVITSNGIPDHKTGAFPNRGNPNRIAAQAHVYRIPAQPTIAEQVTPLQGAFGVAINGVPWDPGAAEYYDGEPGWRYEPLSGAIDLGIDFSHAHVQPNGKYHYHGLPTGLLDSVKLDPSKHSPLIGWAADGFPIYAMYGYSDPKDPDSEIVQLTSSFELKKGERPGGDAPDGEYDGTFVADYQYVAGSGDLDECNGRETITPEFPDGTYAYFLTENWPVVPRAFRGTPSSDFVQHRPRGGRDEGRRDDRRRGDRRQDDPRRDDGEAHGPRPHGPPPRPGQVLPEGLQRELQLSAEQREEIAQLQKTVDEKLAEILTAEQQEQLKRMPPPPPPRDHMRPGPPRDHYRPGPPPPPHDDDRSGPPPPRRDGDRPGPPPTPRGDDRPEPPDA
ncbi:MAG: YHYH protein [Pirellulaceae bacterium]